MNQTIHFGAWQGVLGKGLAERELYCLLAVASGHTDKEIAKMDGLSPRSIKGRVESAMFKLGVFKRGALVAAAFQRGIISLSSSSPSPEHQPKEQEHEGVFIA